MSDFKGFADAALDFYEDLEDDNTKSFWEAHKHVYDEQVLAPMKALTDALEPEFGTAKVFRPYRDVRFSKDKTPYKTNQGAVVSAAPATGWYVEISAAGLHAGAGFYDADAARLAVIRRAIDEDRTGAPLDELIAGFAADGWEIGGERVKTTPRGFPADHPRIELLRHKQLYVGHSYGTSGLNSPDVLDRVRADWTRLRPLVEWLAARQA